jgi:negative regulator of sigma E activity
MTDDDDISRRYRELAREEPPRHLDDAILAAARRAVHTRPAPLVVPSGRQRWYFPVAAAAIIVLAVAVTVHMEREQPAEELVSTPSAPAAAAPAVAPSAREMARNETAAAPEKPKPERKRNTESTDSRELRDQAAAAPPPELQKA